MKQIVHLYTHFNIFESIGPSEGERETIDLKVIITERYKTMTFIQIFFSIAERWNLWFVKKEYIVFGNPPICVLIFVASVKVGRQTQML